MVNNFETLLLVREVDAADVHKLLELTLPMVTEEREDREDSRRRNVKGELVFQNGELLNEFRKTLDQIRAIFVKLLGS